jgi:trk system potassium uptake protein
MHNPILFRLLGFIARVLALAFALCLGLAIHFGHDFTAAVKGFGSSLLLASLFAWVFHLLGRNARPRLFRREALAVIGLGWILSSLLGALPYLFILPGCSFADACFESVSGFTTTGATVFPDYAHSMPPSLLFWRSLSQWIGGLGVVVLFVAIASNMGAGAKILFSNESSGQAADFEDGSTRVGAKRIVYYYLTLSATCFLAYLFCGLSWFDALCHMLTTVSTGGFSTLQEGVPGFANPALEWAMIGFMFLGGFSFLLVLRLLRNRGRMRHEALEGWVYTGLFLVSTFLIFTVLSFTEPDLSEHERARGAAFQVISIMTTTGYATADFAQWASPRQMVIAGFDGRRRLHRLYCRGHQGHAGDCSSSTRLS